MPLDMRVVSISVLVLMATAFSGGGCMSARDLARFGLLFARDGLDIRSRICQFNIHVRKFVAEFAMSLPSKEWLRYSNHLMTDGRVMGHAVMEDSFLLVDTLTNTSFAFLSVLENEEGYDDAYMGEVASTLRDICAQ